LLPYAKNLEKQLLWTSFVNWLGRDMQRAMGAASQIISQKVDIRWAARASIGKKKSHGADAKHINLSRTDT
jgi:hypothetical protein